ncbi:hypothetical protein OC844_001462 [Tilletia horrida]|nr:hypothetical protein OC844_001462 [Tilletia horrida]
MSANQYKKRAGLSSRSKYILRAKYTPSTTTSMAASSFATDHVRCLLCPQQVGSLAVLCTTCASIAQPIAPNFVPLGKDEEIYKLISSDFLSSWKHPTLTLPVVNAIYAVLMDKDIVAQYEHVRAQGQMKDEMRLYHGTRVECNFASDTMRPCDSATCYLCRIVRHSFRHPVPRDVNQINGGAWDRYGSAIYTTPISSKAADYENMRNATIDNQQRTRNVVLARVATGRMQELSTPGDRSRTAASSGYDSIVARGPPAVNFRLQIIWNLLALAVGK